MTRVLIVGGGVTGPVTAMALQRAGIDAALYEAHPPTTQEVGYYLTVASNGINALGATDASPAARSDAARLRFAGGRLLVASGLAHTILRDSRFMQNLRAQLSTALGRTIRYRAVPVQAARAALRGRGVSDWQIEQLLAPAEAFAAGEVGQVTEVVARLTGRPPRTFAEFAHDLVEAA
jgi:uncharacterized protein YbjT (DUF2867 family)